MSRDKLIERAFPKIRTHYKITSPEDYKYNCIAFAAGDTNKHWWPKALYWPEGIPSTEDLNSFIACFKSLGYEECEMNGNFEPGYENLPFMLALITSRHTFLDNLQMEMDYGKVNSVFIKILNIV